MGRSAAVVALVTVLVGGLAGGCSGSGGSAASPTPAPTPITELDADTVRLARIPFCDRLSTTAVERALGGAASSDDTWGSGDPLPGRSPGDVGHELGCSWSGPGTTASAWVFARPVGADFATTIVRRAAAGSCPAEPVAYFGSPALVQQCAAPDGATRVRYAGLFGDTWLTCEVTGPAAGAKARADRWCAQVVRALTVS